jgi:hypothetical protein
MQFGRNYLRLGYRQIFPAMIDAETLIREMPPYFQLGRTDIAAVREEEFNNLVRHRLHPAMHCHRRLPRRTVVRRHRRSA